MAVAPDPSTMLPAGLPLLRARLTLRLLADAPLPAHKGAMLRGGFGYAFQRTTCPAPCWGHSAQCAVAPLCPYRQVFETPRPPGIAHLHNLQDIPRPFVIAPSPDPRTHYAAGEGLELGLVLIGRGVAALPSFLDAFAELGRMGLGRTNAPASLERVEALRPWQPTGTVVYQDGRALPGRDLPLLDGAAIHARAAALPADLTLTLTSPLRIKARGAVLRALDLGELVRAACWRINALSIFYGAGPWAVDHRPLVDAARAVAVEQAQVRWLDLLRTSTRDAEPHTMPQGGLLGSAVLRGVPENVRALLLAGSVLHVGKACTFGHGAYAIRAA